VFQPSGSRVLETRYFFASLIAVRKGCIHGGRFSAVRQNSINS